MSFKILLLAPDADPSWPEKIRRAVPGVVVNAYSDPQDALDDIAQPWLGKPSGGQITATGSAAAA